ncbi:hypothetical protein RKD44_007777 [Streptomyces collinus]
MATKDFAEGAVQRMKDFRAELDNLARRGPSKDLLRQIMGPEQGAQLGAVRAIKGPVRVTWRKGT